MKKKILSFLLALCFIVPATYMLSACGEKQYDIEITTNTQIDHIQEIKFSSSSTKKTTYRNTEDTFIEVICDQGYAPDLVFTVGNLQISQYKDDFGEVYNYSVEPATVSGVRYVYTVATKDLTGKQTVTYSGNTKDAKIRLTFTLDKGGDNVDPFGGDHEGLSFEFSGLAGNTIKTIRAGVLINYANENQYLMLDYDKPMTITLYNTSGRPLNGSAGIVFYIDERYRVGDDETDWNAYYKWTVKSDVNFEISLILRWLQDVFPQEII